MLHSVKMDDSPLLPGGESGAGRTGACIVPDRDG